MAPERTTSIAAEVRAQCPLCGSRETRQVFRTASWAVRSCQVCTNAWTEPPPQPINYAEENFHKGKTALEDSKSSPTIADLPFQWQQSLMLQAERLTKALAPGSRVLEIGCGEGLLLEELARRGLHVIGIEPSIEASALARKRGLDVRTGSFPDVAIEGQIDAVVMSHVLEHLPEPEATLSAVGALLSGGHVLLVQTNWRGLIPRLLGRHWYAWVPEQHYWHFSPQGLTRIFTVLGWRTQAVEYSSLVHSAKLRSISALAARMGGMGDQFQILAHTDAR